MDGTEFAAARGYRLEPPGHPQGASCGAEGPSLGPIPLLAKTATGFEPRPLAELNRVLSFVFAREIDCAGLIPGLTSVACALDSGDLALAMITTTHLRLPYLSEEEARRAASVSALNKASPDDPEHPGWPAGTPGGCGGRFRPKDEAGDETQSGRKQKTEEALERRAQRAFIRQLLRKALSARAASILGEAAANAIPGLNVPADIALAAQIVEAAAEFAALKRDADAALEFVKYGPYNLEDLFVDKEERSFSTYAEFKKFDVEKVYGEADEGFQYHHLILQSNSEGISSGAIHSSRTIIRIPTLLHEEINGEYERKDKTTGQSLRQALKGCPANEQYDEGLKVLRRVGIIE
ncbi:hypothetical protein [Methylocystis heyeri]|uniref:Uncharacterized protein n=1 Tax=Methylocystis heyeri TaxID=391905 RepID=A0A6B8KG33_9HYPH|nr:hypothetical protein [Methylocystis heyeri]QGM46569.1 hypothetical protein H2LOC_013175 [Methylocystis heyeri]